MKVLVTGATGFLGQHVVALLKDGHEVVAGARRPHAAEHLGVEVRRFDLAQPETLVSAVEGCDAVVHAAGSVSHQSEDAGRMYSEHVTGTEQLIAAAKSAGVSRFVHLSSSGTVWVSADSDAPRDESAPDITQTVSTWPYYRSKKISEQVALAAHEPGVFDAACLNPTLLLGPGDRASGQSTASVRLFLEGSMPLVPGGTIAFVDVRDVAEAISRALTRGTGGKPLLLNAANWSWRDFYDRVARMSGKPAPMGVLPAKRTRQLLSWLPKLGQADGFGLDSRISREELELASHHWSVDASKAHGELGWKARDPLDTIADTVEDLQAPKWSGWASEV